MSAINHVVGSNLVQYDAEKPLYFRTSANADPTNLVHYTSNPFTPVVMTSHESVSFDAAQFTGTVTVGPSAYGAAGDLYLFINGNHVFTYNTDAEYSEPSANLLQYSGMELVRADGTGSTDFCTVVSPSTPPLPPPSSPPPRYAHALEPSLSHTSINGWQNTHSPLPYSTVALV